MVPMIKNQGTPLVGLMHIMLGVFLVVMDLVQIGIQVSAGAIAGCASRCYQPSFGAWSAKCNDSSFAPGVAVDPNWVNQQWQFLRQ